MDLSVLEIVENITSNRTHTVSTKPHAALELIYTTLSITAVAIDAILAYVILHFKRLHNRTNILLVNWCIADAIGFMFTPAIFALFVETFDKEIQIYCFLMESEAFCYCASLAFQMIIVMDWYIDHFCSKYKQSWRNYDKLMVTGIWTTVVVSGMLMTSQCFNYVLIFTGPYTSTALIVTVAILVIVAYTLKCFYFYVKKLNLVTNYGLALVAIIVLVQVFGEIFYVLSYLYGISAFMEFFIIQFLKSCSPIIMISLLCVWQREFKACLARFFKCKLEDENCEGNNKTEANCNKCNECGKNVLLAEEI